MVVEDVSNLSICCPLCQAKGGKRRYVPILPELAQELRTHLRDRTQGYLFETNRNSAFSPRRIQQLVKETAALAGIIKRVSPHILRHSVATTLLEHGMPLEQIQRFLPPSFILSPLQLTGISELCQPKISVGDRLCC